MSDRGSARRRIVPGSVLRVALEQKETLEGPVIVLAVYGVYTFVSCVAPIRRFGKAPPFPFAANGNAP